MADTPETAGHQHTGMGGTVNTCMGDTDHRSLEDILSHDEIARVTFVPEGSPLATGEAYLDVNDIARGPFAASGDEHAPTGSRLVARTDLDVDIWERLTGG